MQIRLRNLPRDLGGYELRTFVKLLSAACVPLILVSCSSKQKPAAAVPPEATQAAPAVAQQPEAPLATKTPAETITAARNLLKTGNVEEAAAQLARLQLQGASFNAQQAKDYRQALSDAYERAAEAVQRGDPKGQAALELLRAAGPR